MAQTPTPTPTRCVLLVNAIDNTTVGLDDATFSGQWHWIRAPRDWTPGDPLPEPSDRLDAVIVFSTKYEEEGIRQLCEAIRRLPELATVPLLVAVNQYQMPLANRVRQMPNTDFIVAPIDEATLVEHLDRAAAS